MSRPIKFNGSVIPLYDVVVIGSGPIGATYTRILSESESGNTPRILLVESGQVTADPPGIHVNNLDANARDSAIRASQGSNKDDVGWAPQLPDRAILGGQEGLREYISRPGLFLLGHDQEYIENTGLPAASGINCVGGMATRWTGACPRPGGSEVIPFLPSEVLDNAFGVAERLLGVTRMADTDPAMTRIARLLSSRYDQGRSAERRVQRMPLALSESVDGERRWSGVDTILGDSMSGAGVDLLPGNRCVRVTMDQRGRATGVDLVEVITGRRHHIRARVVVLAADSIRTPRLLFASGVRPEALGRYLNEHHMVVGAVKLAEEYTNTGAPSDGRLSGVSWIPFDDTTFPLHGQIMHLNSSPVDVTAGRAVTGDRILSVGCFAPKQIQNTDRLRFDESTLDEEGLPTISIDYTLTNRDLDSIERAKQFVSNTVDALGDPIHPERAYLLPRGFSLHYQGTMRMGEVDDDTSVCDRNSRVWGTENLYVGGNGVIPTETACNPTLTSVALAAISAEHIRRDILGI